MDTKLNDLTSEELRNLLSQTTKIFLQALDHNASIEVLESIRNRFRSVADVLKVKEMDNKNH